MVAIIGMRNPIHARQIRKNLSLNNEIQRVTLIEAAAATSHGTASLENRGASSRITAQADNEETIPVGLVDFFDTCGDKPIDILKMDIEGSEYEILADNRLEGLSVKAIILEWHQHGFPVDAPSWCKKRLTKLGYAVHEIFAEPEHGMLWAVKGGISPSLAGD